MYTKLNKYKYAHTKIPWITLIREMKKKHEVSLRLLSYSFLYSVAIAVAFVTILLSNSS